MRTLPTIVTMIVILFFILFSLVVQYLVIGPAQTVHEFWVWVFGWTTGAVAGYWRAWRVLKNGVHR